MLLLLLLNSCSYFFLMLALLVAADAGTGDAGPDLHKSPTKNMDSDIVVFWKITSSLDDI